MLATALVLAAAGAGAQGTADEQWPVSFSDANWKVQVFAPQPESLMGDRFKARAAVSLQRPTDSQPVFGAIWADGTLELDRNSRLGQITEFTVIDARFPGLRHEELGRVKELIAREIPLRTRPIMIDWMVAALEEEQAGGDAYNNSPPDIIYRERPSVLLTIDGEAHYQKLADAGAESDDVYRGQDPDVDRVVNTPFFLARWRGDDHYLYGSGLWFRAPLPDGPWTSVSDVPAPLRELAERVDTSGTRSTSVVPEVVVRHAPAELIDFDGPPELKPLQHTNLLYATNTDDDVFLDIATQEHYLLASGRWFTTRDLKNGPWRYVPPDELPTEFARIPEGSAKDHVLAHVPGTTAAREAVRDASIPQTARVDRSKADLMVNYDGDPRFERIEGTDVYEAINASTTVLRIKGRYHVCDNAVWYESDTPDGPWTVSTEVPAEVNTIPPASAAYNTRYVYIYDHDPSWVYTGYTPGYLGCYVQSGVVIYGTGYYYRPWPRYWHPRPWTWGFNMFYDPWVGWSVGGTWGWNWFYPSWTYWGYYGGYHPYAYGYHPYGWWGPVGWCPPVAHHGYSYYGPRPSLPNRASGGQRSWTRVAENNIYTQRPNAGVRPSTVTRTQAEQRTERSPQRDRLDHYPDRDGTIYRRDGNTIQRYDDGDWQRVPRTQPTKPQRQVPEATPERTRPTPQQTTPQQRIQQQRSRGDQRVNELQRYQHQRAQPAPPPRVAPQRQAPQRTTPPPPTRQAPSKRR